MARSSMARTLLDQGGAVVAGRGFRDVETHEYAPPGAGVEHILYLGSLVAEPRVGIRQNISHIVALFPVGVVAERMPDEDRPEPVFERQAVGELALDERFGRQRAPERKGCVVVPIGPGGRP